MEAQGLSPGAPGYEPGTPEEVVEAVKLCLELGNKATDVNVNGDTALHGAAIRGNNAVVLLLVEAGARLTATSFEDPALLELVAATMNWWRKRFARPWELRITSGLQITTQWAWPT